MDTAEELAERVKQLETENRRLVAMLDALDDHVILLDPEARVLFRNRATEATARTVYGRPREEMIGRSCTILDELRVAHPDCDITLRTGGRRPSASICRADAEGARVAIRALFGVVVDDLLGNHQ